MRHVEFHWLRKALYSQAFVTFIFWSSPIFVAAITFGTSILLGTQLTAGGVLSALATFRILQEPLRNFPDLVSMMAQTKVSLDRISGFLQEEELQEDATIVLPRGITNMGHRNKKWRVSAGTLTSSKLTLSGIQMKVERGMRVAVCGMVGSGKSSFLSCILGEIPKISGEVSWLEYGGSAAYVSQSAWIQSGNIEENILFGSPMDRAKYKKVLHACSLKKDLELFSHGDQTIIGDRGINLSGGQKQRVQLARALYQDADIYLLDDPSVLSMHTLEYIMTALATKTVIFVTHQVEFLPAADMILVIHREEIRLWCYGLEISNASSPFCAGSQAHHEAIEAMDIPSHSSEDSDEIMPPNGSVVLKCDTQANNIENLARKAVLVATFGLEAAQKLFVKMLRSVFRAPMSFFDSTPAGRILNRVSIDQSVVDLDIPFRLGGFASTTIQLLGIVGVMTKVTWQVLLLVIPMAIACLWMQNKMHNVYISSKISRLPEILHGFIKELVRIVSIQKSPVIHLFGESIAGAATIRGFGQEKRFMKRNLYLLDCFGRPFFYSLAAIEWLCLRMELLSTFVFAFCMILLVSFPHGSIDPSMAGLAVTYGLNLNARLSRWILSFCKLENKIISIERIHQYSQIPGEAPPIIENSRPPSSWPENGTIELIDLKVCAAVSSYLLYAFILLLDKVRYKESLPVVLHSVTANFLVALFRMIEPAGGKIIIDNIDISTIGLHDIRSRLSIIPQDPTLLEGTIRGNLDPLEEHSDQEIWQALDKSQLGDVIRQKEQKLDTPVLENGDNWSVGQRQLVSLGQALLKQARILVLDEATASVDTATDNLIQKIIRTEFQNCTVCTIAHRIPTVIDSDLVLVLSDGRVAEFDTPARLLEDKSSMFLKLVTEYSSRSSGIPDF
ncbi:ABC transporter C family member 5 [Vitis vinifera]|uniref:ABC-type xenobiotic transporter n=1 Tax=Vitis vinifera TaxID=29760 RepID=A0A438KD48_VITVI|nr:ABC transporter C family member 5 [Vitis vinifera]